MIQLNQETKIVKTIFGLITAMCVFAFLIAACAMFRKIEDRNFAETSILCPIEDNSYWTIYYHKNTKVMWIRNKGSFGGNNLEVLVDSDDKPLIWENDK